MGPGFCLFKSSQVLLPLLEQEPDECGGTCQRADLASTLASISLFYLKHTCGVRMGRRFCTFKRVVQWG